MPYRKILPPIFFSILFLFLSACGGSDSPWEAGVNAPTASIWDAGFTTATPGGLEVPALSDEEIVAEISTFPTPTPDAPHNLPNLRSDFREYTVQAGDTLALIAQAFSVSIDQIIAANEITNPDLLSVGQALTIPPPDPANIGPAIKIIPDSELVYGPGTIGFDAFQFIGSQNGYLSRYNEEVGGESLSGARILSQVAQNYSINPRLLIAVLEYQSGWVTKQNPESDTIDYPIGLPDPNRKGLFRQLSWAANNLNLGFYQWRVGSVAAWVLVDGTVVPVNPTINAGTAGVQQFFSNLYGRAGWETAVLDQGFLKTFTRLFDYPFVFAVEPLLPADLSQPIFQLPFEGGDAWLFTGGPHGGWDSGSAWAALDFAPPGEPLGCTLAETWVVAVTDGEIVRSDDGAVVQDLDGDGVEQTGWTVLYLHIGTKGRVKVGTEVKAGDRIGHASCEGGFSQATHLHLARRYNGEWIPADQPGTWFVMDGWISQGDGSEYDGFLIKGEASIEAWNGRSEENEISR